MAAFVATPKLQMTEAEHFGCGLWKAVPMSSVGIFRPPNDRHWKERWSLHRRAAAGLLWPNDPS